MQVLTSIVLAAFVAYGAAMFTGKAETNFELILFLAVVVTGLYWLAERFVFKPQRTKAAAELDAQATARRDKLSRDGIVVADGDFAEGKHRILEQPWWLDWTAGLFPVILVVFLLRSFLFEPFKIPSGSMIPTLYIGDLILVNKYAYGVRLPVLHTKLTQGSAPARGDVMVFRYPPQPSQNYIKRVIGVPGDEVAFVNKRLFINGEPQVAVKIADFLDTNETQYYSQYEETLGTRKHLLLNNDTFPALTNEPNNFAFRDNCQYNAQGFKCKVPAGHYFMMGDNRDHSSDSRYWGFVPDDNIVGKAVFIWMSFDNWMPKPGRFGSFN